MYDIVIGRSEEDKRQFGDKGTVYIGKHYVQMGRTTSLSNNIYFDVTRSHVVFVCGKRVWEFGENKGPLRDRSFTLSNMIKVVQSDTDDLGRSADTGGVPDLIQGNGPACRLAGSITLNEVKHIPCKIQGNKPIVFDLS